MNVDSDIGLGKGLLNSPHGVVLLLTIFLLVSYLFVSSEFVPGTFLLAVHFFGFAVVFYAFSYWGQRVFRSLAIGRIAPFLNRRLIYALAVLSFAFSAYKLQVAIGVADIGSLLSFRDLVSNPDNDFGGRVSLGVGFSFPLIMAAFVLAKRNRDAAWKFLFLLSGFLVAAISTSKVFLLIWIMYLVYGSKQQLKTYIWAAAFFVVLFGVSHLILEKFSSTPEVGVLGALANTFKVYLWGGVAAYQKMINGEVELNGYALFYPIKSFLGLFWSRAHLIHDTNILPWTDVGLWFTNTYTGLALYFPFFGNAFPFIVAPFMGFYCGAVFSANEAFRRYFDFYKPFLMTCLIFLIMGDLFLPAIKMHLIYGFLSLLLGVTKDAFTDRVHFRSCSKLI